MRIMKLLILIGIVTLLGCRVGVDGVAGGAKETVTVKISPANAIAMAKVDQTFTAAVTGTMNTTVTWSIQEGSSGGTITGAGVYTCSTPGTYHIVATSQASPTAVDTTSVTVQ
jgi:chitinase